MKTEIEFIEDKEILNPLPPENEIKGKSIEGWVYKNIPGATNKKRLMIVLFVIAMFGLSFYLILLSYLNIREENIRKEFDNQVKNSQKY